MGAYLMVTITQSEYEISAFVEILRDAGVRSFLEIGSRFGGSLDRIGRSLPAGSRIVSCDSGKGMGGGKPGAKESLYKVVSGLKKDGYDAHLVMGHSQAPLIVKQVRKLGPFDAVFIDGDHEYEGARKDWLNFGRKAKICGFHDMAWVEPEGFPSYAKKVEVPRLWAELKDEYRSQEFVDPDFNMGIGVLWI
jgi:hypothetical protein